jgi:Ca2+-binding EF-hand superfamily protein
MKVSKLVLAVSMASVIGFSGSALAKGGERDAPKHPTFEMVDVDASGSITESEFDAAVAKKKEMKKATKEKAEGRKSRREHPTFQKLDKDGNGEITADEFTPKKKRVSHTDKSHDRPSFEDFDLNADGEVSLDEMQFFISKKMNEKSKEMFEAMDKDGNGSITKDELEVKSHGKKMKAAHRSDRHEMRKDAAKEI